MSTTVTQPASPSTQSSNSTPVSLLAHFNYYAPPPTTSAPSTNDLALILGTKDQDTRLLPVIDIRGLENKFTLDTNGFQYIRGTTSLSRADFDADEPIEDLYYKEVESWLKNLYPGTTQVHHLGHILRGSNLRTDFSSAAPIPTDPAWNKPNRNAAPAPRVHIDFTSLGVHLVLCQAFGEATAKGITDSGRRVLAFSIWRPLTTVRRDPLGICDARSVRAVELVKLPRVYPDGAMGENVVVKATGSGTADMECKHRWYWMSDQKENEVLVIKIYDSEDCAWESDEKGRVGSAPHASFSIPGTEREEIRESIEVRCVVVL